MWNLREYRQRPQRLSDHLPWAALLHETADEPAIVLNKDGSFQQTVRFRGPDLESSTPGELMSVRARMNHLLRRFGSGWCMHLEAARRPATPPDAGWFSHPLAELIDDERRERLIADPDTGNAAFESTSYLTLTWLPPEEQTRQAASLFFESPKDASRKPRKQEAEVNYRQFLDHFRGGVAQAVNQLGAFMPEATPLNATQTLTYLHSCVSDRAASLTLPDVPFYLDELLTDRPFVGGLSPRLGPNHLKIVSVRVFANQTVPCLLDALNELPSGYRWVVRWIPMDKTQATAQLNKLRRQWFAKRKGVWSLLKEAITKTESALEDTDALNKARDVDAALQELGGDFCTFGDLTLTITVADPSEVRATDQARAVQQIIDSVGLVSEIEDFNAVQAWLGSLPGHAYANVRRPMVSSLNLCDLAPLSSTWSGPHPASPGVASAWSPSNPGPLIYTQTAGSTPFRLSLHQGDVGHTLIAGPTGAGKSTLLNLLAAQWLRYPDARVYIFDKGASCRAVTLGCGGCFFVPGDDAEAGVCFQPLAAVDREDELAWAQGWVGDILQREGVAVTPALKQEVWSALSNLGSMPVRQRTMSTLYNLVQDSDMRHALRHYTLDGPYGQILDADSDALDQASDGDDRLHGELAGVLPGDWLAFEMEHLMHSRAALVPVLTYLFHRLERRFGMPVRALPGQPQRVAGPTLLILDEAWLYLTDSVFAARIREWLKVLRKKNVSVVFATQSLTDIAPGRSEGDAGAIASAIVESCLTRIFLPNASAREEQVRKVYASFGLNDRQLAILQQAVPRRDYYYSSREGNRLFELGLDEVALTFCAAGSPEDQQRIDRVLREFGNAGAGTSGASGGSGTSGGGGDPSGGWFAFHYLHELGLVDAAERLRQRFAQLEQGGTHASDADKQAVALA